MTEVMEKRRVTNAGAGLRRRCRTSQSKRSNQSRVRLEQVLGLTASCSSLSASSGLVAYPAGCVVVLLDLKSTKQRHILNSCRKPFSALSFSYDGKLIVTGESGHLPCVRVWDLEGSQKAEVQTHKYGVSCVAFSHSDQYIVSVGFQHDMTICVWDWKKGALIASNKVSSNVSSVSFSEDSSYFVTAGNRHLKFWYLHQSANNRVNSTVPLIGRSALLGEHKNSVIVAVACGRGVIAARTFCLTSSALLCVFNSQRTMEAWVHLKVSSASSLSVCGDQVFCGCSNGIVRVFSSNLSYICTLQHPHRLGVELQSSQSPGGVGAVFPDTVALGLDSAAHMLTVVYSDHSLYCWDLTVLKEPRRAYSALYHSGCIWSLEVYPDLEDFESCLPPHSFLTSSSDNTIRVWCTESPHSNRYSQDLQRIVYVGESLDSERTEVEPQGKSGLRVLTVSPDGAHLATGDRHGNLSVFGLEFEVEELHKIEAHNAEILCLSFSPESSGMRLLASASRDRLIHIFNRDQDYNLIQSLYDHSGSITAVRFTGESPYLKMVSCGADKSIYVQTAEQETGLFLRTHHVVEKSSIYDLDLDSTQTQAAFACQDRNIRVYSVESGKLMKTLKGSTSDEGALLKVTFDPSGLFVASSCSDKTICIFDYESGECVATLYGHSEIVTSIRFSADCTRLITASGDGCIFVWRLDSSMTSLMRKRRGLDKKLEKNRILNIRRETFITSPSSQMSLLVEETESEVVTPGRADTTDELPLLQTNGKMPLWFRKLQGGGGAPTTLDQSEAEAPQVRRRWAEQMNPIKVFSQSPNQNQDLDEELDQDLEQDFCPQSLESLLVDKEEGEEPAGVASFNSGLFPDHSASDRRMSLPVEQAESEVMTPGRVETKDELPLLQTNGKMPLWFRKMQGGGGAPASLNQSEPEPPQVKKLWAEQMNPIKVFSQNPTQNQDVDEELGENLQQDFCPQSLESLLVDEGEGDEPAGVALCSFGLFPDHRASDRDFAVQGCPSQAVKGEEDQDFVTSDGSTESSEQNHDADCESLSESTSESMSSLILENHRDPLEENQLEQSPLQKHFDSLALSTNNDDFLSLSEERFDTDLRNLQPPKQKHFLQPRLSLSTRFLSRFQDRIRSKALTSVPRILEESSIDNIQVQLQTEPSLKTESGLEPVSSDFGLKTTSTESSMKFDVKGGSQRNTDSLSSSLLLQGIVGNGVSVKQEFNQRIGFYDKENVNPDHDLKNLVCESPGSVVCGGAEELLGDISVSAPLVTTPPKSTVPLPPAAVSQPPDLALSPPDTEQGAADDITFCPASECDRPHPPPGEQEVQQVALRLQRTVEEAVQLYRQVQSIPALAAVLRNTFEDLHSSISTMCGDSATDRPPGNCSSRRLSATNSETENHSKDAAHCLTGHYTELDKCNPCGHLEHCNHTVALLERYSDLLVQMTRDKLN